MLQDKSPTKEYMMLHKDDPSIKPLYKLAFLKRPAEELFDLVEDPFQIQNVASDSRYQKEKDQLKMKLENFLRKSGDPRARGESVSWDTQPYYKDKDWIGTPRAEAQELFGLEKAYPYR